MNIHRLSSITGWQPAAVALCFVLGACSGGGDPGTRMATPAEQAVTIDFKTDPNPPRSGANEVQVEVHNADGTAVTDATISAVFYMPAMPSMSMPEMRDIFTLEHTEAGTYVGRGNLQMAGTWDVTVSVNRDGAIVAKGRHTVIAK